MFHVSSIEPDVALKTYLSGKVFVGSGESKVEVPIYGDWERPTNLVPDDFISVYTNGDIVGVGADTPYATGFLMVSLYCRLNDDGTVKKHRINKILEQVDTIVDKKIAGDYYFYFDARRFITPTTPNQSTGYSVTTLNLIFRTTSTINKPVTP